MRLLTGDLVCLAAFVLLGLRNHEELAQAGAFQRFLVNAGPLFVAWTLAALALGALRFAPPVSLRLVLGRTLTTWLVAAPLALVLRAQATARQRHPSRALLAGDAGRWRRAAAGLAQYLCLAGAAALTHASLTSRGV